MPREIILPPDLNHLPKPMVEIMIKVNDDVLYSHCKDKKPIRGVITSYGIVWNSYNDFEKDAEETCHYFWQLYTTYPSGKVVALSHADEIYNLRVNPILS